MARNKRKKINDKDKFKGIREEAKKRCRQKKSREKAIKKGAAAIARNLANSNVREIMEQNRGEPTNPWPRRSVTVEHASKEINPSLVVRTEKFLGAGRFGNCYLAHYRDSLVAVKEYENVKSRGIWSNYEERAAPPHYKLSWAKAEKPYLV